MSDDDPCPCGNFHRGDTVCFNKDGKERWGQVLHGPVGRHKTYTVRVRDVGVFHVPFVLLTPQKPN